MRPDEREALRRLYQYRCGYCGVRERDVGAELTTDHFQPRSRGGSHEPGNWVYSCHACNEFKADWWQPNTAQQVLHPLSEDLAMHLVETDDGSLQPLTDRGAFHIERLHLNRRQLVAYRRERKRLQKARAEQNVLLQRLKQLEVEVVRAIAELISLHRPDA